MTLADRGVGDESVRITVELLELIVGCTTGCQFHIRWLDLSKDCVLRFLEFWCHYDWDCRVFWFDDDG